MNDNNLIWIDLEMTGLNPDTDMILEIATVVTDSELNVLAEGPVFAIFQPNEILEKMDEWNQTHHGQSGLIQRVKESTVSIQEAERLTLAFLQKYVPQGKSPMCGNSICQDRRFLWRLMPQLEAYFFYRHIDVSTLKELAKRWKPSIADGFKKESEHLALQDIHDSIAELKYYRQLFLQ
jgi:oligoribonuclease